MLCFISKQKGKTLTFCHFPPTVSLREPYTFGKESFLLLMLPESFHANRKMNSKTYLFLGFFLIETYIKCLPDEAILIRTRCGRYI